MANTVKVEALKPHTYNGKSYEVGDTYDFEPILSPAGISADQQVQSLQDTGFAVRVDRKAVAKAQSAEAKKSTAKAAKTKKSTAVAPMGVDTVAKPAKVRKASAKK